MNLLTKLNSVKLGKQRLETENLFVRVEHSLCQAGEGASKILQVFYIFVPQYIL